MMSPNKIPHVDAENIKPLIKRLVNESPVIQEFCKLNNKCPKIRKQAHRDSFDGTDEEFETVYSILGYGDDEVLLENFKRTVDLIL